VSEHTLAIVVFTNDAVFIFVLLVFLVVIVGYGCATIVRVGVVVIATRLAHPIVAVIHPCALIFVVNVVAVITAPYLTGVALVPDEVGKVCVGTLSYTLRTQCPTVNNLKGFACILLSERIT
jgi:hypothetical protein